MTQAKYNGTLEKEISLLKTQRDDIDKRIELLEEELNLNTYISEKILQDKFKQKYGETFDQVLTAYFHFVFEDKNENNKGFNGHKWNLSRGHAIYIPHLSIQNSAVEKHGLRYSPTQYGNHILICPEHYEECLPSQKIKDAFSCMGWHYTEFFDPVVKQEQWGN